MKVAIIGTRGIPAKYGGFETFAEELSPLLVKRGFDVSVQCDRSEQPDAYWNGVRLYHSPFTKSGNPFRYYFDGIIWGLKNSDIIIVTGTGGSFFYFLKLFYKKIIVTNTDGIESKRLKWSFPIRCFAKAAETVAVWFSDYLIADSKGIFEYLAKEYRSAGGKAFIVEYGAHINDRLNPSVLEKYEVKHNEYYLVVNRIEPENNVRMILEGYCKSGRKTPLLVVGNLSESAYIRGLLDEFSGRNIRFMGGIYEKDELNALRYSCKIYIHGHSVGGTNPSLLEALGSGNVSLCHDNIFNREVTGNKMFYFKDSEEFALSLSRIDALSEDEINKIKVESVDLIKNHYNWHRISEEYEKLLLAVQENKIPAK